MDDKWWTVKEMVYPVASNGTYVGLKFTANTSYLLSQLCQLANVPNALKPEDFHVTVMYSRVALKDFEPLPDRLIPESAIAVITGYDFFGDGILVAKLDFKFAQNRHHWLMSIHDEATWDHPDYTPHVTMSYDAKGFDPQSLPTGIHLIAEREYIEEINPNWVNEEKLMLNFEVSFKAPDVFDDAVEAAMNNRLQHLRDNGVEEEDIEFAREQMEGEVAGLREKWLRYGEVITVAFSTTTMEARIQTAK